MSIDTQHQSETPAATQSDTAWLAVELLLEAGGVLASSLDLETTMTQIARLTVPRLADLCVVDVLESDGTVRKVAAAARDETLAAGLEEVRSRAPIDLRSEHPVALVIRSGEAQLLERMSASTLENFAQSSEHAAFMIAHGYRSAIVSPLLARGRTLGALSLLRLGDEGGPYTRELLDLGNELARRAALAIDNAALFADLRSVEQRLEAILVNLAEAITVMDERGHIIFANRAAAELLGFETAAEVSSAPADSIAARFLMFDASGRELSLDEMPGRRLFRGERPEPLLVRNVVRATGEERWLNVRSSPILDPLGERVQYAVNVYENITDVKRVQLAETFMAEASRVLASSMDYASTLQQVARLAVPQLADWCVIDVLDERGGLERVAVHHADPAKLELAERLNRAYPATLQDSFGIGSVARSGSPVLASDVDPPRLARLARDEDHLKMLRELGMRSVLIVPLAAPSRTVGAITLVSAESARRLTSEDVGVALRLGRRAGTAVESARLYTERTRIAKTLERALLPESLPRIPGIELAGLYRAAGELNDAGGDFYDVLQLDAGRWMLVIGDVCGKGPRAAGVTALARHTLRAAAMLGQDAQGMLVTLHRALRRQPVGADMATVCLVTLEPRGSSAQLTVALAGHPAPVIIAADGARSRVGTAGTILGVIDPIKVEEAGCELHAGETLLLFTDGFIEAGLADDERIEDALFEALPSQPGGPLEETLSLLASAAAEHAHRRPRDDIALLAARPAPGAGG